MPPLLIKALVLVAAAGAYYVATLVGGGAGDALKLGAGTLIGSLFPQLGAAAPKDAP